MKRFAWLAFGALLFAPASANADDITDALKEAETAYGKGDLGAAKSAIDVASQMLAQKSVEKLGALLPAAPAGWTAEDAQNEAGATGLFGGGLIAKRVYAKGDKDATVQLMANSPILSQMAPLFQNAQLLGAMGKVFRVKGKTAVLGSDGQLQIVLGKTYLTIEGSASEADKRALLDAIDIAAVEAFAG